MIELISKPLNPKYQFFCFFLYTKIEIYVIYYIKYIKNCIKFINSFSIKRPETAGFKTFANLDVFSGEKVPSNGRKDIEWIRPDGQEMQGGDWNNQYNHILACVINGKGGEVSKNPQSKNNVDDDFMIIMCGNTYGVVDFKLPEAPNKQPWTLLFDTAGKHKKINDNGTYSLEPYSYVLLTAKKSERSNSRTLDMNNPKVKAKLGKEGR